MIERTHPLFDILRDKGLLKEDTRGSNLESEKELNGEENNVQRPQDYDEVLDYIKSRWEGYEPVTPGRRNSENITRSDLLNMAMKTKFKGSTVSLLGSVIEVRDRDIVANRNFEGLGLESVKVDMEDLSNTSKEYLTSKGATDMDADLIKFNRYRFIPEVYKVDRTSGELEVGFNKVFHFKNFERRHKVPSMSVEQPHLVVKCHSSNDLLTFNKIEMRVNTVDRVTFNSPFARELKTYDNLNIRLDELEKFIDEKRDISLTDIIKVSDEEIINILKNRDIGGYI